MTDRRSSTILDALGAALGDAGGVPTGRNVPLGGFEGFAFASLDDGKVEQTEEFFSPTIYEFTLTADLVLATADQPGEDAGAALRALIAAKLAALTEGGLLGLDYVTALRPQPPVGAVRELFGAADMQAALLPIEIDYWAESSAG